MFFKRAQKVTVHLGYFWKKNCSQELLKKFPKKFSSNTYDGFSDHTIGIETSLLAISRGAKIIERHFSLDKSDNTIRDHVISSTPSEFRLLVELGRELHKKYKSNI